MINNKKEIFLKISLYTIIGFIYIILLNYIFNVIDVYYDFVIYLLIINYLFLCFSLLINNKLFININYGIMIFILLFLRNSETGYNFDFYLISWLKHLKTNKIVLINIIGNIILFIPLGIINKKIIYSILIIILIETLQLILKKGIFDIVDIVLNTIGVIIGTLGVYIWMIIKKKNNLMSKKI